MKKTYVSQDNNRKRFKNFQFLFLAMYIACGAVFNGNLRPIGEYSSYTVYVKVGKVDISAPTFTVGLKGFILFQIAGFREILILLQCILYSVLCQYAYLQIDSMYPTLSVRINFKIFASLNIFVYFRTFVCQNRDLSDAKISFSLTLRSES
jgi:hypothetical protein